MTHWVEDYLQKLRQNIDPHKKMPQGHRGIGKLPKVEKRKPAKLIKWK